MRRFSIWGLLLILALVLAACGGDDKKDDGGDSGGGETINTPLPAIVATALPIATATFPPITNPTLPPAATIDVRNSNGNAASGNTRQPTAQTSPLPTRGGAATLPPTWTPSSGNNSVGVTPSVVSPTVVEPTIERPAICETFAPDFQKNPDQHYIDSDLTIYWLPVSSEGVAYSVELYDPSNVMIFTTEVTETQITFTGDHFPSRGMYYWVVQAKLNGVVINCGVVDNEVFVSG